ncbi:MAG: transposase [Gemmatimonadota bacterium]
MGLEIAAVSFPQRFRNSRNPQFFELGSKVSRITDGCAATISATRLHFHVLAVDGVLSEAPPTAANAATDGPADVQFYEAAWFGPEHSEELARLVQHRVLRAFRSRGLLADDAAADMLAWQGTGGFSVDASVRIEADDRAGLERLVRYCARGPLALERLYAPGGIAALASPDARLVYRLPGPDPSGRTELWLTPIELPERIARLVPPPRIHRHRSLAHLAGRGR